MFILLLVAAAVATKAPLNADMTNHHREASKLAKRAERFRALLTATDVASLVDEDAMSDMLATLDDAALDAIYASAPFAPDTKQPTRGATRLVCQHWERRDAVEFRDKRGRRYCAVGHMYLRMEAGDGRDATIGMPLAALFVADTAAVKTKIERFQTAETLVH